MGQYAIVLLVLVWKNHVHLAAGANVEFLEIEDLSHTYPREENNRIIDWLLN